MQKIRPLNADRWKEFRKYAEQQLKESSSFRPYLFKENAEFNPSENEFHYLVLDGDTVYGYFFIEVNGGTADIGYGVLDCYKGSGWGTRMVEYLLERARSMRVQMIEATADVDNYRSILLLYKFGFRVYKETTDGEHRCVSMRKML